ncbi:MAG: hypothetical protein PQJ58_05900 [Spirochaetales bacterium]|nr:hypothetical protein [Spirochaetales bacterium]
MSVCRMAEWRLISRSVPCRFYTEMISQNLNFKEGCNASHLTVMDPYIINQLLCYHLPPFIGVIE